MSPVDCLAGTYSRLGEDICQDCLSGNYVQLNNTSSILNLMINYCVVVHHN